MDIQKERESFQKFCEENFDFDRHEQTYFDAQTQCYENDMGEDTDSINMAWSAWQARAKAQTVPEGCIIVPLRDLNIVMELAEDHRDEYIRTSEFPEVHKAIHDVKAIINDLKAQLNNMEACYIEVKKERDELEEAKRDYVCDCGYLDSPDYEECDCRKHSEDLANEVIAEIVKKANFAGLEELLDELKCRAIKHGVLLNKQALRGEHE